MKYKVTFRRGKYRRKIVLEWHEKLIFLVLIITDVYILLQILRYIVK